MLIHGDKFISSPGYIYIYIYMHAIILRHWLLVAAIIRLIIVDVLVVVVTF